MKKINVKTLLRTAAAVCALILAMGGSGFAGNIHASVFAGTENHSRAVNVVYDDSGSMIRDNKGKKTDRWCQAKYSLEVFASMMGNEDTMRVFPMSYYEVNNTRGGYWNLKGSDGARHNVNLIHKKITQAGNTPIKTVNAAVKDLNGRKAAEKWLVILTDGKFESSPNHSISYKAVNKAIAKKDRRTKVIFLGMGPEGAAAKINTGKAVYFKSARDSKEILTKVTEISSQVFNSDELAIKDGKIQFDVSMKELMVFAQGKNVKIHSITAEDGRKYMPDSTVKVRYSTKASSSGYGDAEPDKNLKGQVAVFRQSFKKGKYDLHITGEETKQVYYKPDVGIDIALFDRKGNKVTDAGQLKKGSYTLRCGLKDKLTGKILKKDGMSPIHDVHYDVSVSNNGKITKKKGFKDKTAIQIEEGDADIDAFAVYNRINTLEDSKSYAIVANKKLKYKFIASPEYIVQRHGVIQNEEKPIRMQVTADGEPISDSDWDKLKIPKVMPESAKDSSIMKCRVEKTDQAGIFDVFPVFAEKGKKGSDYRNTKVNIRGSQLMGEAKARWSGSGKEAVKIRDARPIWERKRNLFIRLFWIILALILILGYTVFKHRFPKRISKRPRIDGTPLKPLIREVNEKGAFSKQTGSVWLPYKAERGTIRFVPRDVPGVPRLKVKAMGDGKMEVTNTAMFAGREDIEFNGKTVEKEQKENMRLSSGTVITVITNDMEYNCQLRK